ncbi:hypothetical protein L6452_44207 [Arctium lappa]|uniref:Uncharacterized protein n=1 Tax=Arctium lappa TaxID=4217 RepID=A0ACB8XG92_ARCLA|nr:hypothetical protein L6452_44207 [Arctium lappa]
MGNTFTASGRGGGGGGGRKRAKVMKIDGEIIKLKTPIQVFEVIKDYPGHVLLESKAVMQYGIRANPLDPEEYLEAGKIYFLVELPKPPVVVTRRVLSGVNLTAKERLDCLMMSSSEVRADGGGGGGVKVKVRLRKAEVDKLIGESRDEVEVAERIVDLYVKKKKSGDGGRRLTVG